MNGHSQRRESKTLGVRWRALLFVDAAHGGPRWQVLGTYALKREADAAVTKALDGYLAGTYRAPSRLTVGTMVDRWLTEHVAQLRPLSRKNYGQICEHFILPAFGDEIAEQVTPAEVSAWMAQLLKDGRRDGRGPMSPKYVRQVRFVFHAAYSWSVKLGELSRNPVDAAPGPSVPRREFDPPSVERMRQAMEALKGTRYRVPMALASATGMRRGEVLGLAWSHVDLDRATLRIRRQLTETPDGLAFSVPKTEAAIRDLHLPAFLVATLREEMARQQVNAQIAGLAWSPEAFVCPAAGGGPIPPDKFSRGFTAALKRRGLAPFRFHDLRHAVATEMLESGERADVVQRQLGHAQVAITLGIYAHVRPGELAKAASRYGRLWDDPEPETEAAEESRYHSVTKSAEVLDMDSARRRKRPA